MFKIPNVGSPGCVLIPIGGSVSVVGIVFLTGAVLSLTEGEGGPIQGGILLVIGTGLLFLGFGTIREAFESDTPPKLLDDTPGIYNLTERERKFLENVIENVRQSPSNNEILQILSKSGEGRSCLPTLDYSSSRSQ